MVSPGPRKTVLIRAIGPALAGFGIASALEEPTLTLLDGPDPIAVNTRWNSAGDATTIREVAGRVGAFALPEGSADSALLATLAPGPYTARVTGVADTTGIALIEIYDADTVSDSEARLVNLSVRAEAGAGADVLAAGFAVRPGAPLPLLLRGVGPGLVPFGVASALAAADLALYAGALAVRTNSSWNTAANEDAVREASIQVGAFPLAEGSRDSVLLAPLSPGTYTLQVTGTSGANNIALIEVYEAP